MTARDDSSPGSSVTPWKHPRVVSNHKNRKLVDWMIKGLTVVCLLAVLIPLGDMLYMFAYKGLELISIPRLLNTTGAAVPGLSNAIVGTAVITGLSCAISIPLGIFGGVYMAEFSKGGPFGNGLRFAADVLAGVPSIILGYIGYVLFVQYFGWGYSILAGAIVLSIVMFPYIFRTTDIAMRKVPLGLREGGTALGGTKTTVINKLVLRFALPGIFTGVLLSIGIALSETAPLLYTAGFGSFEPSGLSHWFIGWPVAYLTGAIWTFYQQSSIPAEQALAYVATFLLIIIVIALNLVTKLGLRRFSKV